MSENVTGEKKHQKSAWDTEECYTRRQICSNKYQ